MTRHVPIEYPEGTTFTLMVDHKRLNPDRVHQSYLVSNHNQIHDLFGNYIPYAGIQLGDLSLPYVSKCWQCGAPISSQFCKRSKQWEMGYHCPDCGEDLSKYYSAYPERKPHTSTTREPAVV